MSAGPPRGRGVVDRLHDNPSLVLGALVFTIIAGVVAVATLGLDILDRVETRPEATAASRSAVDPPAAPNATLSPATTVSAAPPQASPIPASSCIDDSGTAVDCREPHHLEQFGGACTSTGMIRFMAGQAGLDVVLATVSRRANGCAINIPVKVTDTAAGALARSGDDAWRRCVDKQRDLLVACNEDHTGEYLATGAVHKANLSECNEAAERYMGQTLDNVADLLAVRIVDQIDKDPSAARCLIEVRGSQPLTASLRRLGVSPVPIRR